MASRKPHPTSSTMLPRSARRPAIRRGTALQSAAQRDAAPRDWPLPLRCAALRCAALALALRWRWPGLADTAPRSSRRAGPVGGARLCRPSVGYRGCAPTRVNAVPSITPFFLYPEPRRCVCVWALGGMCGGVSVARRAAGGCGAHPWHSSARATCPYTGRRPPTARDGCPARRVWGGAPGEAPPGPGGAHVKKISWRAMSYPAPTVSPSP